MFEWINDRCDRRFFLSCLSRPRHLLTKLVWHIQHRYFCHIEESDGSFYIYFKSAKRTMWIIYRREGSQGSRRRTTRLKWSWPFSFESAKSCLPDQISLNMRRPAPVRYPSWTRWRPRTPPEMGFAASRSRLDGGAPRATRGLCATRGSGVHTRPNSR